MVGASCEDGISTLQAAHHGDGPLKPENIAQQPDVVMLGLDKPFTAVQALRAGVGGDHIQPQSRIAARLRLVVKAVQQGCADAFPARIGGNTDAVDQEVVVVDLARQQAQKVLAP